MWGGGACANPLRTGEEAVVGSPAGIEPSRFAPGKTRDKESGDVGSDVVDRRTAKAPSQIDPEAIADLASRLAALPPDALAALQALFGGYPGRP